MANENGDLNDLISAFQMLTEKVKSGEATIPDELAKSVAGLNEAIQAENAPTETEERTDSAADIGVSRKKRGRIKPPDAASDISIAKIVDISEADDDEDYDDEDDDDYDDDEEDYDDEDDDFDIAEKVSALLTVDEQKIKAPKREECTVLPKDTTKLERSRKYVELYSFIYDFYYNEHGYGKFPAERGRSLLKTVYDNMDYIEEPYYSTENDDLYVDPYSALANSGLVLLAEKEAWRKRIGDYCVHYFVPKEKFSELILSRAFEIIEPFELWGGQLEQLSDGNMFDPDSLDFGRSVYEGYLISFETLKALLNCGEVIVSADYYPERSEKMGYSYPRGRVTGGGDVLVCGDNSDGMLRT